jgi:adenine deaminase
MSEFTITGQLVDIFGQEIYPAAITISGGKILTIKRLDPVLLSEAQRSTDNDQPSLPFLLPGFIDAHVHIESSMLVPSEFARLAVVHGTIATVSDPHEIGNVCGVEGVEFMIKNGKEVPFKFCFGAPSCVPATIFETAGATIDAAAVTRLLEMKEIMYLSEMMNFPGVLNKDPEVMEKIAAAQKLNKPVDGHAPGLRGELAKQYIDAGISTDHECFTAAEALDKLGHGMKIIIREGSAARNFDALIDLLHDYPESIMFCSDDKHPDSLVESHINALCKRAVERGIDVFKVLRAACINPALHYQLPVGLLREGDAADIILADTLTDFNILQTYIDGELVASQGKSLITPVAVKPINQFSCREKQVGDFRIPCHGETLIPVIEALDGQLITNRLMEEGTKENDAWVSNPAADLLKMVVVNRYHDARVAKAFVKNFGLKRGAIASSVAHDSHNIIAVGADDESICAAVNALIECRGGVSCFDPLGEHPMQVLPLPVAGLMSDKDGYWVADQYAALDAASKALGSGLGAPFMTLSFMALLVIPHLKLSDKGLFDGDHFQLLESYRD